MSSDLLSTNEAAAVLKVGASTVKRWADEGRLECVKTAGGHRRFHRQVIAQMLSGSLLTDSEISAQQILDDTDGHASLALLYQLRSRYGAWWVAAERVASFLHQVGEDWEAGTISIVEEHTISERLVRALTSTCQAIASPVDAPVCLFVMAEGDDHTLGLRLAELVAKEAGWRSQWVGRNTPLEELSDAVADRSVCAIAASASAFSSEQDPLIKQVRSLERLAQSAQLPLALGGTGAWPESPAYGQRTGNFEAFRGFLLASMKKR